MLITTSKGSNYVSACIELLPALVLQFEILRALTIMLEAEGANEELESMSSLPSNEFLDSIFEKEDLIEGFQVIWFVIKDFFVSLEISGGP